METWGAGLEDYSTDSARQMPTGSQGDMNIQKFATEHRLKLTKDGSGEDIELVINGRVGQSRIYQHDAKTFGVLFMTDGKRAPRTGLFNKFQAVCTEVGMTATQKGEAEGVFTFDPLNPKQAKVAIKAFGQRRSEKSAPNRLCGLPPSDSRAGHPILCQKPRCRTRDIELETRDGGQ
jgi:hypothetical protein